MRTESDVEQFRVAMEEKHGDGSPRADYQVACFEACVPKSFWGVASKHVTYNRDVFDEVVCQYRRRMKRALRGGYSLLFVGDNGVGKTMFISYLLTQAIKNGLTAYYTTLAQLDIDIKRGFRDRDADNRLRFMLESDFIGIDEVGKESFKADSFLATRLEHLLKQRYDDEEPVLLGSNVAHDDLIKMYGSTIESMIDGKYQVVGLEPGDCRRAQKKKMKRDMGYGD